MLWINEDVEAELEQVAIESPHVIGVVIRLPGRMVLFASVYVLGGSSEALGHMQQFSDSGCGRGARQDAMAASLLRTAMNATQTAIGRVTHTQSAVDAGKPVQNSEICWCSAATAVIIGVWLRVQVRLIGPDQSSM